MPNPLFEIHGDQMKRFLEYVFRRENRPRPDDQTIGILALLGVAAIARDSLSFNTGSFLGTAYTLVHSYNDPAAPHYGRIQTGIEICLQAIQGGQQPDPAVFAQDLDLTELRTLG